VCDVVFDVPRDLEDHMVTHDSIWILLPALSMQRVYAYIGHSDSSLVLYEIYIGSCIRLVIFISYAYYFTAMWANVDHHIGRDYFMLLVLNV
jgi:hypothetical protein